MMRSPGASPAVTKEPETPEIADVQKDDVVVGTGAEAKTGNTVKVHYTGTLTSGTKFDSSHDRNEPFSCTLGAGGVIKPNETLVFVVDLVAVHG